MSPSTEGRSAGAHAKPDRTKQRVLLELESHEAWRAWLERHHDTVREVWVVFWKKHTGRPGLTYEEAVEEALCFGWIDSVITRLDEGRYAQKMTPRTDRAKWSESNRRRLRILLAEGRVTAAGLAAVDPGVLASLEHPDPAPRPAPPELSPDLAATLAADPRAHEEFLRLPPSHRKRYVGWIMAAAREQTRRRRLAEAMDLLARGERLGLK